MSHELRNTPLLSLARYYQLACGVAYGISDIGLVRPHNEDNFLIDEDLALIVVADGMGGHETGALASADALVAMRAYLLQATRAGTETYEEQTLPYTSLSVKERTRPASTSITTVVGGTVGSDIIAPITATDAINTAFDALIFANQCLFSHNLARLNKEGLGMGTTLTGMWQSQANAPLTVFHVGDSRLYRYRQDNFALLTRDQTMMQLAIDAGETSSLPASNLLWQAVGPSASIRPDVSSHHAAKGDIYLFCSDGLHSVVPHESLHEAVSHATVSTLEQVCASLITLAKNHGSRDNITAILLMCD